MSTQIIRNVVLYMVNGAFLLENYINYRQRRQLTKPVAPEELRGLCSQKEYEHSRLYSLDKSRLALLQGLLSHIILLTQLSLAFMPLLWAYSADLVRKYLGVGESFGGSEILISLVYMQFSSMISQIIDLPFSIYGTFVIERRHGFNKMTVRTFIMDMIKSNILSIVLGGPIFAGFLWVLRWGGPYLPFYVCAFLLVVQILMILIYPTLIQPLFNKFTPLAPGTLRDGIEALAKRVAFPLKKIFVIDGSTRSTHSNAYFIGLFKDKRIVIYDTLIEQSSEDEICAIVGHELGHWKHGHTLRGLVISQLSILLNFSLFSLIINHDPLYEAFGFSHLGHPLIIGLFLFQILMTPISLLLGFISSWISRQHEFQADRFAVDLGYSETLQEGLIKLHRENKNMVHPDWLYSAFNYSHPPLSERLAAIRSYATKSK